MATPKNVVELLRDLVAIPSVNPAGDPGTDKIGEQALAEYVAKFLKDLGAEVEIEPVEPGRPNVIASFTPAKQSAHLTFAPHLDTVGVAGMTIPPFDPVVRDGKLYGRGSSDTKGPMAASLWALHEWAKSPERASSRVKWSFLGLMGEETGGFGAMAMAKKNFACDLALALEPTELAVVTAQKGTHGFTMKTSGVACHASTPHRGKNAIYAMRRALQALEDEVIPGLTEFAHPKLGAPTMSVGIINGGSRGNIVADQCTAHVDCRVVPGLDLDKFHAKVEEQLRAASPDVTISWHNYRKPLDTDESLPWVKRLGQTARGFTTAPWFSDAAVLSSPNCPAVCIGPGAIAQAHTKDEFILVSDLEDGANLFRRWIQVAEESAA